MTEHTRNMYGRRTYEETPKFYISDLRPWPESVRIIKGHSGDVMEYVPIADVDKLRELIGILAFCTNDEAHDCDKCAINGAEMHVTVPEWLFCDSLIERLRTLGFEVSE